MLMQEIIIITFAYAEPPSSWPLSWAECLTLAPGNYCYLSILKETKPYVENKKSKAETIYKICMTHSSLIKGFIIYE